jgi:NDP-sugar pyrophosphorylase family protein
MSSAVTYVLRWLSEGGVTDATLCANSATRVARHCLGDARQFGVSLRYLEDHVPRGPAGCVRDVACQSSAERFVVADACHLPQLDLSKLMATHVASRAAMTVALTTHNPETGSNDSRLRPVGVYVIEREALDRIPGPGYQDIKEELIPQLRRDGMPVLPYIIHDRVFRLAGIGGYLATHEQVVSRIVKGEWAGADFERLGGSLVHRSADISSRSRLIGPCVVGPDARIAAGVTIVGPTVVGEGVLVEQDATVSRSALWEGCRIGGAAAVDSAVVTHGATVRAAETVTHGLRCGPQNWQPRPECPVWTRRQATGPARTMRKTGASASATANVAG